MKQKPNKYDNIMDDTANYKYGRDTLYYWIIIKKKKLCLGPLLENEFNEAKIKYNVPSGLNLEIPN